MSSKNSMILLFILFFTLTVTPASFNEKSIGYQPTTYVSSDNIDALIFLGKKHIEKYGNKTEGHTSNQQEVLNVLFILLNPINRIYRINHQESIQKNCKKILSSLGAFSSSNDPSQISMQDKNPNYAEYIFHQRTPPMQENQYTWVIEQFKRNLDSRKATINLNQPFHKTAEIKELPRIVAMQFMINKSKLSCIVSSLKTNIEQELPGDIAFFSFITELIHQDLKQQLPAQKSDCLDLGDITIKTNFAQLSGPQQPCNNSFAAFYNQADPRSTLQKAATILEPTLIHKSIPEILPSIKMPAIENAQATIKDIVERKAKTKTMQWLYFNADIQIPQ